MITETRRKEIILYLELVRKRFAEAKKRGFHETGKYGKVTPDSPLWKESVRAHKAFEKTKAYREWLANIHLQPREDEEAYLARAEDESTWRRHLEGESGSLRATVDKLRPDAARGRKVLRSASQGGQDNAREHYEPTRVKYRDALVDYIRNNPNVSRTEARNRIAQRFCLSLKTITRHTRDLFKTK